MTNISELYQGINSRLSLKPLVAVLNKMIAEDKPGARKLYQGLLNEVAEKPALLEPMKETAPLKDHAELVESLLSTIFPPSTNSTQGSYAITFPFHAEVIYSSASFRKQFLKEGGNIIYVNDKEANQDIARATLSLAYDIILKKFFGLSVPLTTSSIHPFTDPESGLTKYYELRFNTQFVDVDCVNHEYKMPSSVSLKRGLEMDELKSLFPLANFEFQGFVVVEVNDVTQEQVINEIKNTLLNINAFSDVEVYNDLQQHVQSLIGLKNVGIGITPFFKLNNFYLYTDAHYRNSLLFSSADVKKNKDSVSTLCQEVFKLASQPILYETIKDSDDAENELLKYYKELGAQSLIICPLKSDEGQLLGLLEIMSEQPGKLQYLQVSKIQPALTLFSLALEKGRETMEGQIDKIIKEHFTAIQPAVEWKFTEAAFNYIQHKQVNEMAKMPTISFDNVYPLYGAVDIRNSSVERNNSIQQDLLEQLTIARDIIQKARKIIEFPLLDETLYRIEKYIASASDTLLSDDETLMYDFMQYQLEMLFQNLRITRPELKKSIDTYLQALDPQKKIIYHHRKNYEESITRINDVLDRFIDQEQREAQEIFPHYFERYVTDGIEFNIYIGQSLSLRDPFNEMYLRNIKLWQLTLLAKAAKLTYALEKRLPLALQTTQLVLVHSLPLSISFRRKERKFDVEGAYNIRYEIVKKRIDKVHIKDTEERLTQPGKIGIVYSQHKELSEYLEYIEFLQHEQLLGDNVEYFDLEDTQGISGLKAIRVDVNYESENSVLSAASIAKSKVKV